MLIHAIPLSTFVFDTWRIRDDSDTVLHNVLILAGQVIDPIARLALLQEAEHQFRVPAGSLMAAAGIGTAARQQLEELLCGLLLTVPDVRVRLRNHTLPFSQPSLREIATHVLRQKSCPQHLTGEAERLASLVDTARYLPAPAQHGSPHSLHHEK